MPTSPKDILPGMFIYAKVWIIVQHYDINAAFWMEKNLCASGPHYCTVRLGNFTDAAPTPSVN